MIIDAHTHIHPSVTGFGEEYDASVKHLIKTIGEAGVDRAVVLPIYPIVSNSFIAECCKIYPKKLIGFASADPTGGKDAAKQLLEEMKRMNFKGLKFHPKQQGFRLTDPEVQKFFKYLDVECKAPAVIDCWFSEKDDMKLVQDILAFVEKFKQLPIILAHAGGFKHKKIIPLAKRSNIYLDLSYSLMTFIRFSKYDYLKAFMTALKKIGASKIIFGSDFPECTVAESISILLEILDDFEYNQEDKAKILSGNILKLIGG